MKLLKSVTFFDDEFILSRKGDTYYYERKAGGVAIDDFSTKSKDKAITHFAGAIESWLICATTKEGDWDLEDI